jgi:hypothetical protein
MRINLKIEGDYRNGNFICFLITLERDKFRLPILLTAEQSNLSLESDDPLEAILPLKNILSDSGFTIFQTINIVHGDNSNEQVNFLSRNNKVTEEPWYQDITVVDLCYTNPENPNNSNIVLKSSGGHEFIIYTESDSMLPIDSFKILNSIFNQG